MSKFAAALKARQTDDPETVSSSPSESPAVRNTTSDPPLLPKSRVGRPAGKRSNEENTQVTGYVPAQLYYDVRIKLMERKRRDRKAKTDFSDLLREWMEHWLAEQP